MQSVSVVIPAYNEGKRIKSTLRALKLLKIINKIIVVNDGSTDNTAALAREEGAFVLDLNPNRGKGGAMNAALPLIDTEIIVFLDADLGQSAQEVEKIIQPVMAGDTDLCIAAFPPPLKKGGFGIVKGTASWILRKVGDFEANSPLSGQRAMNRKALKAVMPFNEGYGVELGMTVDAMLMGLRVMEIPTAMRHNESGRDLKGFWHRGKQFVDLLKVLQEMRRKGI